LGVGVRRGRPFCRRNRLWRAIDEGRAAWHVEVGDTLYAKGDLDGAIDEYREALRLNPNDANTHNNLGVALEEGDRRGALEQYRAAYMLEPKDATYKRNYERLLRQMN
jgi:Flp pilus assembly protein TadD